MPNPALAKKSITEAANLCVAAGQVADRHAYYVATRDKDVKVKRDSLDAGHPAVAARLKDINSTWASAEKKAASGDYLGASQLLDSVRVKVAEAAAIKSAADGYETKLRNTKAAVTALTSSSPRKKDPVIGPEIEKIDAALAVAEKKGIAFDYIAAVALLDDVALKADTASVKKKIKGKAAPAASLDADLKAIATRPGGEKLLDDMVAGLTDSDDPAYLLAALKARFTLEAAETQGAGANATSVTELKRIYVVMTKVPASHTKENPSFKKITRKPKGSGSSYSSSGEIVLSEGHPDASGPRPLAIPTELPDIDPNSRPNDKTPPPKFIDWNTLHEVGHALDDKAKFMETNGGQPEYGGWVSHSGDIITVAKAAANEFAVPSEDIAKYLDNGTEPAAKPANWAKMKTWADAVRSGNNPWKNGAGCGKKGMEGGFILNHRIYHEAYSNIWVSYNASARKSGMTGYQFRAPGEWFSELYAAYKSDKMKPAHPARKWLDKLFGVKTKT